MEEKKGGGQPLRNHKPLIKMLLIYTLQGCRRNFTLNYETIFYNKLITESETEKLK